MDFYKIIFKTFQKVGFYKTIYKKVFGNGFIKRVRKQFWAEHMLFQTRSLSFPRSGPIRRGISHHRVLNKEICLCVYSYLIPLWIKANTKVIVCQVMFCSCQLWLYSIQTGYSLFTKHLNNYFVAILIYVDDLIMVGNN